MLRYDEARQMVIAEADKRPRPGATLKLGVGEALGHVLAEEIRADREYPPFDRSTRDGYAVCASEAQAGAKLHCSGEVKAGDSVTMPLAAGSCMQIMTGAAVPPGADAVVMIEFTSRDGDTVSFERNTVCAQNIVPRGSEAHAGDVTLHTGQRLGFAELAIAAQVGATALLCNRKPRVAILLLVMRWCPSARHRARSTFATATAFRWPRKCALRAGSQCSWVTRRTAAMTWAKKSSKACSKMYWCFRAACPWASTT